MKGTIYIIKNTVNKKVYIGQTTMSVKERWTAHMKPSTAKQRHTYKLYNAIRKYGRDNFYYEILEENIDVDDLNYKEILYIEAYDSFYNGYNSTKGGDGRYINKQYDVDNIIFRYKNGESAPSIALDYDVCGCTIRRILEANNIERRQSGRKLEDHMIDEILELVKTNTYEQVGELYGVDKATIRRFLKKHGFRKRNRKVA